MPRLLRRLVSATAVLFAGMGLVMLHGARGDIPPLRQMDAVFGCTTRTMLVVAGGLHLAISGCLFATRDAMSRGFLVLWASLNYLVYFLGLAWLKAAVPLPAVVVLAWELGVGARFVYVLWKLFIAYLLMVGLLLVVLERRRLRRLAAAEFLKRWKGAREHVNIASAAPEKPLREKP